MAVIDRITDAVPCPRTSGSPFTHHLDSYTQIVIEIRNYLGSE